MEVELFVGHYAPAYLIKAKKPEIPLWTLFVATQLVDIAWAILVLLGIEKVRIIKGFTATNPLDLYFMPYTHSLLAAVLWGIGSGLLYRSIPTIRPWILGVLYGVAVLSHWFLDLLVHAPDLPLYGNSHKVGFALWNFPTVALVTEIGLLFASLMFFKKTGNGRFKKGYIILTVFLILSQLYIHFGPLPQSPELMAATALISYILFAFLAFKAESYSP